jgi:hypothetical protein
MVSASLKLPGSSSPAEIEQVMGLVADPEARRQPMSTTARGDGRWERGRRSGGMHLGTSVLSRTNRCHGRAKGVVDSELMGHKGICGGR